LFFYNFFDLVILITPDDSVRGYIRNVSANNVFPYLLVSGSLNYCFNGACQKEIRARLVRKSRRRVLVSPILLFCGLSAKLLGRRGVGHKIRFTAVKDGYLHTLGNYARVYGFAASVLEAADPNHRKPLILRGKLGYARRVNKFGDKIRTDNINIVSIPVTA
jgi:hypothetical protein